MSELSDGCPDVFELTVNSGAAEEWRLAYNSLRAQLSRVSKELPELPEERARLEALEAAAEDSGRRGDAIEVQQTLIEELVHAKQLVMQLRFNRQATQKQFAQAYLYHHLKDASLAAQHYLPEWEAEARELMAADSAA